MSTIPAPDNAGESPADAEDRRADDERRVDRRAFGSSISPPSQAAERRRAMRKAGKATAIANAVAEANLEGGKPPTLR